MKFLTLLFFTLFTFDSLGGLPPTTSKVSGESTYSTTFKTDFGSFTGTRSGTTLTLTGIGAASGTSLALGGALESGTIFSASSTTAAIVGPRMSTTQKTALTPSAGWEVYDNTLNIKQYYNGTQWVANTNIQLDNVYSAKVSSAGVVSGENVNFINGDCAVTDTSLFTCSFNTGIFSVAPNCEITIADTATNLTTEAKLNDNATTSSVVVRTGASSASTDYSKTAYKFNLTCQKSSTDYQSTDAYIASNSNTGWASCGHTTSDFTGFGTVSNIETQCKRSGGDLVMRGKFTSGSPTATEARVALKFQGASLTIASSVSGLELGGAFGRGETTTNDHGGFVMMAASNTYIKFSGSKVFGSSSGNYFSASNGSDISNNTTVIYIQETRIPISGWSDSNLIIASLQGTPNIPGSTVKVDTVSFTYGTGNANTVCSASPCSHLNQLGSGTVSMVTFGGTGTYSIVFARTYSKIFCIVVPAVGAAASATVNDSVTGTNTNSVSFVTVSAGAAANTRGTVSCTMEY